VLFDFDFVNFQCTQRGDDLDTLHNLPWYMIWRKCSTINVFFFLFNRCRWGCSRMLLRGLGLVAYNLGLSRLKTWPIVVSDYQCLWQKECVMDDFTLKCFWIHTSRFGGVCVHVASLKVAEANTVSTIKLGTCNAETNV